VQGASARAGAKPYPVGLPEAGLSICPGWGGTNLLPARMNPAEAIRRTASGKPMMFDEAVAAGLVDAVAPEAGSLAATAKAWVGGSTIRGRERVGAPSRWVGRPDTAPHVLAALAAVGDEVRGTEPGRAVAAAVEAGLTRGWSAALETEQRELVRLRNTPAGKAAIQAFFDKGKK
jgi:3-hydroxyacyl-CoA dehydrogenase/enoyl-CoA hydratase/3-hydroxybutyryl-CoA epimerase/enoyl-CoA isomerase